jgi:hypothetical protein
MVASIFTGRTARSPRRGKCSAIPWIVAGLLFAATSARVRAESTTEGTDPFETATEQSLTSARNSESTQSATTASDPFEVETAIYDPFESLAPVDPAAYSPESKMTVAQYELVFLQPPSGETGAANETNGAERSQDEKQQTAADPCAGGAEKSMTELGINIVLPSGLLPKDHAALCWAGRNAMGGPFGAMRCWPMLSYYWVAPCLCYRPLYFEETNLERYGYGCCCPCCIQPAVSAAHFFGTIPCLPYCMADHCPCECEYTLGHYRPGSCPPLRYQWPSCKPIAAATEAGVMTGLIFAIP